MPELLELALELIGSVAEWLCAWRFYLCLICSLVLVAGICAFVSDGTLQTVLSVPVAFIGIVAGVILEFRA